MRRDEFQYFLLPLLLVSPPRFCRGEYGKDPLSPFGLDQITRDRDKESFPRACTLRWNEHGKAIENENWPHSGISQRHQHCQEQFDQENATVITTMQDKNKKRLSYNLKVREALEIRRHNSGPGNGLNEDMGAYIKTGDLWDPALHTV